ncbi:hypothetical protein Q5P01_000002 [Channa striata]|uniref:Uncharacterized protein n=1 Tax=Channa striata TaxID=64152 RepID=A0AA88IHW7_CHASR|nr:hypothetical protein Q5P01_000002 [Channa striata]
MTSSSLRSTGGSRICPSCNTGCILPDDLHARCETCLGPEHAGLAVTPLSTCPYCARLTPEEKQRRVDAFVTLLEDDCADDDDAGWAKRSRFTIDEALDILDLPCSEGKRGARGQESPDSAPSIASFPPGSPLFPLENLESEGEQEAPSAQRHSAPPTPPAGPLPACGVLLWDLPEIIKRAADRKSIPLPPEPPSPVPMTCNVLRQTSPREQVITRLTDRAHQCAAQSVAAINNIMLLSSSISTFTAQPGALPAEPAEEISKAMAAVLTFSSAVAVAQSRIMVWMTMLQRNVWLHMSRLPELVRKGLLDGPTSPDGLFGPLLQEAVSHLQRASEEAERVQRLTS